MAIEPTAWNARYHEMLSTTLESLAEKKQRPAFILDKCALLKYSPLPLEILRKNHRKADYFINNYIREELETGQKPDHQLIKDIHNLSLDGTIGLPVVDIPDIFPYLAEWAMKRGQKDNRKHKMNTRLSDADLSLIVQGIYIRKTDPIDIYPVIVSCDGDIPSLLMGLHLETIGLLNPELFREWNESEYRKH